MRQSRRACTHAQSRRLTNERHQRVPRPVPRVPDLVHDAVHVLGEHAQEDQVGRRQYLCRRVADGHDAGERGREGRRPGLGPACNADRREGHTGSPGEVAGVLGRGEGRGDGRSDRPAACGEKVETGGERSSWGVASEWLKVEEHVTKPTTGSP